MDEKKPPVLEYYRPPPPSKSSLRHFLEWIVWVVVIFLSGLLVCFGVNAIIRGYYFGIVPLVGGIALFLMWASLAFNVPRRRSKGAESVEAHRTWE